VAGIDHLLPATFGRLHPRWGTPHIALISQAAIAAIFIFLGQAGTSVKGAYDALVSMSIISYFVPFLYMFAALIKLQGTPAPPGTVRVPGGRAGAVVIGLLGLATTSLSIVLACVPPDDEPNKALAVTKVVGLSLLMVGIGVLLYAIGRARAARALRALSATGAG
jgi:amino acid transporter